MNAFGFAIDSSDIDLLNVDLLNQRYTHLDLLDTDIPGKHFVCLQDFLKTSSRYVFKTFSRYVFKTSSRHVFKTSSRHVFKTSSRLFSVTVLKTNKCLLGTYCKFHFSKSKIMMNFVGIIIMFNCNYFHIKMSLKRQLKL